MKKQENGERRADVRRFCVEKTLKGEETRNRVDFVDGAVSILSRLLTLK